MMCLRIHDKIQKLFAFAILGFTVASSSDARPFDIGESIHSHLNGGILKSEAALGLTHLSPAQNHDSKRSSFQDNDGVRYLLEANGLSPYVAVNKMRQFENISDYKYQFGDHPICGMNIRVVEHADGSRAIVGSIPLVDEKRPFLTTDWPSRADSALLAIRDIARHQSLRFENSHVIAATKCLMPEQGRLEPVWNFVLEIENLKFDAWSTPWALLEANQRNFDAVATVRTYDPNPLEGKLKDFSIQVNGDGTLSNEYFTTMNATGAARARSAELSFIYKDSSDTRFAEASTFAYANQQYDFVKSKGYVWHGGKPVTIVSHARIKGTTNNASYSPPDEQNVNPTINIGDGDNVQLKNLAFDMDVTAHEFGHHVIFSSVYNTKSEETKVLHEGLADFLATARSGDRCLGKSICPSGSKVCQIESKCLRTAENSLTYNEGKYLYYGFDVHAKGQLVSGFLWDLHGHALIPMDTLTTYVVEAIAYLPSNASIASLVAAVLYVDQKHGGMYQSAMIEVASARNLNPADLGIQLTSLESTINAPALASTYEEDDDKKHGFLGCGTLGVAKHSRQATAPWMIMMLFLLPLARYLRKLAK